MALAVLWGLFAEGHASAVASGPRTVSHLSCSLQSWDLVQQTQNYLRLLISLINSDGEAAPQRVRLRAHFPPPKPGRMIMQHPVRAQSAALSEASLLWGSAPCGHSWGLYFPMAGGCCKEHTHQPLFPL